MDHMKIELEKSITKNDLMGFRNIVARLDTDKNGRLSLEEYSKNKHFKGNPRGLMGFFRAADTNQDSQMTIEEYAWQRIITDEARKIFFTMDKGKDRSVSQREFISYGIFTSEYVATKIFNAFDTNKNGELTLPEYLRNWSRWARVDRVFESLY